MGTNKYYTSGTTTYVWIPYTKDQVNCILGSIVQVRLETQMPNGSWLCTIMLSGKPTTQTVRGDGIFITEDEFFKSAMDVADNRLEHYKQYLNEQEHQLFLKGG